jgi:hypothetical protein
MSENNRYAFCTAEETLKKTRINDIIHYVTNNIMSDYLVYAEYKLLCADKIIYFYM